MQILAGAFQILIVVFFGHFLVAFHDFIDEFIPVFLACDAFGAREFGYFLVKLVIVEGIEMHSMCIFTPCPWFVMPILPKEAVQGRVCPRNFQGRYR